MSISIRGSRPTHEAARADSCSSVKEPPILPSAANGGHFGGWRGGDIQCRRQLRHVRLLALIGNRARHAFTLILPCQTFSYGKYALAAAVHTIKGESL